MKGLSHAVLFRLLKHFFPVQCRIQPEKGPDVVQPAEPGELVVDGVQEQVEHFVFRHQLASGIPSPYTRGWRGTGSCLLQWCCQIPPADESDLGPSGNRHGSRGDDGYGPVHTGSWARPRESTPMTPALLLRHPDPRADQEIQVDRVPQGRIFIQSFRQDDAFQDHTLDPRLMQSFQNLAIPWFWLFWISPPATRRYQSRFFFLPRAKTNPDLHRPMQESGNAMAFGEVKALFPGRRCHRGPGNARGRPEKRWQQRLQLEKGSMHPR